MSCPWCVLLSKTVLKSVAHADTGGHVQGPICVPTDYKGQESVFFGSLHCRLRVERDLEGFCVNPSKRPRRFLCRSLLLPSPQKEQQEAIEEKTGKL